LPINRATTALATSRAISPTLSRAFDLAAAKKALTDARAKADEVARNT
jgi:hypothetical protein